MPFSSCTAFCRRQGTLLVNTFLLRLLIFHYLNGRVKEKGLTLAAKWAPNEHSYFDSVECGRMAEHLAKLLFPGLELPHSKRLYRQLLVLIRKRLRVTEVPFLSLFIFTNCHSVLYRQGVGRD